MTEIDDEMRDLGNETRPSTPSRRIKQERHDITYTNVEQSVE